MIEITNMRQGAVLNHNHGAETDDDLTVTVEGISKSGRPVRVNGVLAAMDGRGFACPVKLAKKVNTVTVSAATPYGTYSQEITVVWDKKSFRRYNFYIDDHSFLFTDLAKERPVRAFDHFYLAGLQKIHEKYGFKATLNCFYRNDHHPFELKDMPDIWKNEFIANSDWLRFSFHSYSEFPDRPYLESGADEFGRDYDLVKNEIIRFAGEESFIPPVVIHWANISPAAAQELVSRGTRCYSGPFRPRVMGGPSLAERRKGGDIDEIAERTSSAIRDLPDVAEGIRAHFLNPEESSYLNAHRTFYDPAIGIFFSGASGCCCNLVPLEEIQERYAKVFENGKRCGAETYGGASHEQYTFPYYPNFIPDHLQRLEAAARCLVEDGGCRPVFFNEGLLGNMAWEK